MEKTNCLLDAVKNQLQNAISNIDAGNSNLNEEEMEELVKTLSVLNKGVKRISKAYACEHILHCSPATFDNYVRAGIIPKGKKEIGFNELKWWSRWRFIWQSFWCCWSCCVRCRVYCGKRR